MYSMLSCIITHAKGKEGYRFFRFPQVFLFALIPGWIKVKNVSDQSLVLICCICEPCGAAGVAAGLDEEGGVTEEGAAVDLAAVDTSCICSASACSAWSWFLSCWLRT